MMSSRRSRWWAIARKASELKLLQGCAELGTAGLRLAQDQQALSRTEAVTLQVHGAWVQQRAQASFHADDEAAYRRFLLALDGQRQREQLDVQQSVRAVDQCSSQARGLLAEKDLMTQRHDEALQDEARLAGQQALRWADELWSSRVDTREDKDGSA